MIDHGLLSLFSVGVINMPKSKIEKAMDKLIAKFKPNHIVVAQADIVGYRFDEDSKALHFLSQADADALTAKQVPWTKIDE